MDGWSYMISFSRKGGGGGELKRPLERARSPVIQKEMPRLGKMTQQSESSDRRKWVSMRARKLGFSQTGRCVERRNRLKGERRVKEELTAYRG